MSSIVDKIKHGSNCYIYLRVSTKKQAKDGFSLENQRIKCESFANEHGLNIMETYVDDGVSGTTFERKQFKEMMRCIRCDEYIIIYSFTRLGRNQKEVTIVYEKMVERGINIISTTEQHINNKTPMGKFMLNTMLNAAEYEVNETTARSGAVLKNKALCGEAIGPIGFGYDDHIWENRRYVYPLANEQEGITFAINSRQIDPPVKWSVLGREMIKKGWFPKRGGDKWTHASLDRLVESQTKYRMANGLMGIKCSDVAIYEKYRAPFVVPKDVILTSIDNDTGYLDYRKVFGYMYGYKSTQIPTPDQMRIDLEEDRIPVSKEEKENIRKALDNGLDKNGVPHDDVIDLSKQDPAKLKNFMLLFGHLTNSDEINNKAKLFFS